MRNKFIVVFILLAAVMLVAQTAVKTKLETTPAKYTSPTSGKAMFDAYCASCHGLDGKGHGPAAPAMKAPLPDLTELAKKNNGTYPSFHVEQAIIGDRAVAAHGSKDMPVWGPVFSRLGQQSVGETQLRLHNLTDYIKSLQVK